MELIEYICSKVKLDPEVAEEIDMAFSKELFPKGSLLIKPNSYCQKIFYVEKGLLRNFYTIDGRDITEFFYDKGMFNASLKSIFYNQPEPYGCETIEDTTIRYITYSELNKLFIKHPALLQFAFTFAIDILMLYSLKLESIQFQTAEQRYKLMNEHYPSLLLRVPLGHIASYLGITQQTLSVIRGKR